MSLSGQDVTFAHNDGTGGVLGISVCPIRRRNGHAPYAEDRNNYKLITPTMHVYYALNNCCMY